MDLVLTTLGRGARLAMQRAQLARIIHRTLELAVSDTTGRQKLVSEAQFAFVFANREHAQRLNQQFRAKSYCPNVLTFVHASRPVCADVILCMPIVRDEAKEQGKRWQDHLVHLVVHGTLHALGWDHANRKQAIAMEGLETAVLDRLGIADPYVTGDKIARRP